MYDCVIKGTYVMLCQGSSLLLLCIWLQRDCCSADQCYARWHWWHRFFSLNAINIACFIRTSRLGGGSLRPRSANNHIFQAKGFFGVDWHWQARMCIGCDLSEPEPVLLQSSHQCQCAIRRNFSLPPDSTYHRLKIASRNFFFFLFG